MSEAELTATKPRSLSVQSSISALFSVMPTVAVFTHSYRSDLAGVVEMMFESGSVSFLASLSAPDYKRQPRIVLVAAGCWVTLVRMGTARRAA